ncbi:Major facilitator superfamily protein [Trifolium repens]|nr:Major facilitator superfamily protein [Trifolium repens]
MGESNDVLLEDELGLVDGAVDYSGQPAIRSKSGYWRSAWFIIGVEVAERVSHYGIQGNLISYLTGPLQQSTATAAENVNIWAGTASLLPLFGAFIADSFLGRYRTIILASLIYILGLSLLTLSATLPSLIKSKCQVDSTFIFCSQHSQVILFFISLYLVAIGQSGHKPCVQAFGADQFDDKHPKELIARSSFFNWWYFTMVAVCSATILVLTYVQDNYSWVLGFGIPCVVMIIGLIVFLLGTMTYRFNIKDNAKSPFLRIGRVFVVAIKNRRNTLSSTSIEEESGGIVLCQGSKQFNFLNKALLTPKGSKEDETCTLNEVEEAKAVLRLIPIWASTLVYGIVFAQVFTFFTKQGKSMERTIFPGFDIPPASLQTITGLAIVLISPVYDRIFVPVTRSLTAIPSGITMLQRIGTGIFLSIFTVVVAALVEIKRLKTAQEFDLVDNPNAIVPMSIWWLVPQYFLFGISEVFTMVGLQEFFYDQVPNELRSMGLALYLSIVGVGSFLSGFLISMIENISGKDGHESWFCDNINKAHLDYFYWLLTGLSVVGFTLFIYFSKSYVYNRKEPQLALVDGAVDHRGQPAIRSKSGYWRSAWFIIGVEVAERVSYYGIQGNLITYLTGPLKQSTASAAENVNIWAGTASLLPLLGAFIADSFLGRYCTIILASFIYILGLGLLTLSAMLPSMAKSKCQVDSKFTFCSPNSQVILFFISLYLVAIGQGGHKPCVQAFGADQFDEQHPKEHRARSSFFNWWYFTMVAVCSATLLILTYIQDNYSWVLGFGIPCVVMIIGLIVFFLGTTTYRFNIKDNAKNPFLRIGRVFVSAVRNRRTTLPSTSIEEESGGIVFCQGSKQFNFLNKALLTPKGSKEDETCTLNEVEEAKAVLRLIPIWGTTLVYGIVFAQVFTFFTKQGNSMERTIFPGFDIPPASLQTINGLAIVIFSPIYDRIFVPVTRSITGKPSGITMLQRIGTGIFLSIFTVVVAALVEIKRLKKAQEYGLVDDPNAIVPMSIWWLVPQYFLFGISEVFTMVGLQEFFYDQVPNELRSMGLALYLSIVGVGSFLSGFLISMIENISGKDGHESWFSDNINMAHLDYFYWLLTGLSVVGFTLFIYFSKSYVYNRKCIIIE